MQQTGTYWKNAIFPHKWKINGIRLLATVGGLCLASSAITGIGLDSEKAAAAPSCKILFTQGHIDVLNPTPNGSGINLLLKEDVTGSHVYREPNTVILGVKSSAWNSRTANVSGVGRATFTLTQLQNYNLLWPGWDTGQINYLNPEKVVLQFTGVSGPGQIYLYHDNLGNTQPILDDGSYTIRTGSERTQKGNGSHEHAYWSFSSAGTYYLSARVLVLTKAGNWITSPVKSYRWAVGDQAIAAAQNEIAVGCGRGGSTATSNGNPANSAQSGKTAVELNTAKTDANKPELPKDKKLDKNGESTAKAANATNPGDTQAGNSSVNKIKKLSLTAKMLIGVTTLLLLATIVLLAVTIHKKAKPVDL